VTFYQIIDINSFTQDRVSAHLLCLE
jgi:hypothetical protein